MSFRATREKAGYSQSEGTKLLGIGQSTVSMWERGVNSPRAATLVNLAALYCCTIDELFAEARTARTQHEKAAPAGRRGVSI